MLEVPNPKRERVTEKRDTISLNQHGAGGRTAVKLPQHLTKWAVFLKLKFIQIGSAVPVIIAITLTTPTQVTTVMHAIYIACIN